MGLEEGTVTKEQVCDCIDDLWVSTAQRLGLKYKIRTRSFTPAELEDWAGQFKRAADMQQLLVQQHAPGAAGAPVVTALKNEFAGTELRRKRRRLAGQLLRQTIRLESGLSVPTDLSRQAVEAYL